MQGYYDRAKGEVVLFEGADAGTLAHEIGWHAVWHWAERNSPDLLLKMKRYAARTPQKLKALIKEVYGDFKGDALMDEIGAGRFERAMGERFQKLLAKSPEVRGWWRKVLHALARAWKGMARTVGGNRVDLKKIEKMDPEEAIEALTAQMIEGRRLGEGRGNAEGDIRPSIAGRKGAERLSVGKAADAEAMEKAGADREEIWRKTGWWRAKDGQWRVELPDIRTKNSAAIKSAWKELHQAQGEGHAIFLRDLIDAEELFRAYPGMEDMKVFAFKKGNGHTYASYNPETESIDVFGVKTASDLMLRRSDLTHEIQHKIQVEEGFAKGGAWEIIDGEQRSARELNEALNRDVGKMMDKKGYAKWLEELKRSGKAALDHKWIEAVRRFPDATFQLQRLFAEERGGEDRAFLLERLERA